ncbi:Cytochrome P450 736A117 [Linum perenne]
MSTQQLEEITITSLIDQFSLLCFLLLGFLGLLIIFKWVLFSSPKKNLPPSPFKLPILGNLHQLGTHPHRSLQSMSQLHGPIMLLHLGRSPTLVISSPESAKEILKTHDLTFSNRTDSIIARRLLYNYKDLSLSPYGEYWRQMRSICVMQLLSTKKVQSFRLVREEEANLMVERIENQRNSSGGPVDLGEMFAVMTEDVISRVAFGKKYRKLKDMLKEMAVLLGIFNVADFVPWLGWINRFNGLNARVEKVFNEFDQFLDEVVDEHVEKRQQGIVDEAEEHKDFVDVLLDAQDDNELMDRDSIKAIILDMFGAGSDTTFTALEWAMTEVLKHPRVTDKLQQDIAVIKESLRLHPPIPLLVPRASTKDTKVLGYDIAAKTGVLVNAWAIGRDPTAWEDAEDFKPERFMGSEIDYKGQDFQLIPFGAGRRGCPGITFAAAVLEIAMAALLHKFDWTFPGGAKAEDLDVSEAPGMAVQRKFPLLVFANPHSFLL